MADAQPTNFDSRFAAITTEDPALAEAKRRMGQQMAPPVQPATPATRPALAPVENPQAPQLSTGMELPPAPHLRDMPAPQPADDRNPLEVFDIFKNPAIVIAGLGSLFTRNSMTTAFNSAAGAINGFRSGQQQVFQENKERWHQAATEALEQNQTEITKYKLALEQKDMKARMATMYALASQYDDPIIKTMMKTGNVNDAYGLMVKREEAQIHARATMQQYEAKNEAEDLRVEQLKQDPGIRRRAQAIVKLEAAPITGMAAWRNPQGRATMELVDELADAQGKAYDQKEWLAKAAAAKVEGSAEVKAEAASLTKQVAQKHAIDAFENNTKQQGRRLLDLARRNDASGVPVVQGWVNAGKRATGDPLIAQFDAQMAAYRPEVERILTSANLAGVLTVHAQQEGEKLLRGDITYNSLKAVIDLFEKDFKTRSDSIDQEIAATKKSLHGESGGKPPSASGTTSSGVTWSANP